MLSASYSDIHSNDSTDCLRVLTVRMLKRLVRRSRGHEADVAGKSGHDAIEPWMGKLNPEVGAYPALSLEVFNREHWKQDALVVAKTGLA